jgi:5'-deoxynucleotidase YfbR-like HD superfamily hydrolase
MVRVSKYGISVKDFDTYEEYKREYDKARRIKDKDKLKEYNKNRDYKEQYQKERHKDILLNIIKIKETQIQNG